MQQLCFGGQYRVKGETVQRTLLPIVNRLLAEVSDQDLLERNVLHDDQHAFTQLVTRYNRLVWGQCRNLLANDADADDAFQATFLTLARSMKMLRAGAPLGPWLHGVAYRVCMNARRVIGRTAKREKASTRPEAQQPVADSSWEKAFAVVAEEVQSLPDAAAPTQLAAKLLTGANDVWTCDFVQSRTVSGGR